MSTAVPTTVGREDCVVLTTYLTSGGDPQSGLSIAPNESQRIETWLAGILKFSLRGIIFHDELSPEFISKYSPKYLQFVKVKPGFPYSENDYRFLIWCDWLSRNPTKTVFCTDLFDVRINRDPQKLIDEQHDLWLSRESQSLGDGSGSASWMENKMRHAYPGMENSLDGYPILSAGVWGGPYMHVLRALFLLAEELRSFGNDLPFNSNMAVFNHVLRQEFKADRLWIKGTPFHSEFKKYQTDANVYFVHK